MKQVQVWKYLDLINPQISMTISARSPKFAEASLRVKITAFIDVQIPGMQMK